MLSATADHALRAALLLARAAGRMVRADEVADAIGAPRNYMAKTLNVLAKSGLVTSARGPLGGFALARRPDGVTVADVVDLFDDPRPSSRCLLGNRPCDATRPCAAHHRWAVLTAARRAPLTTTTLADLISGDAATACAVVGCAASGCAA